MRGSNDRSSGDNTSRRQVLGLLGGSATAAFAGCLGEDNPSESEESTESAGSLDGSENMLSEGANADKAQTAWERSVNNPLPKDASLREESYVQIEEAVRDSAIMIPLYHNLKERFWYDYVDVPLTGALGDHWQQYNTTTLEEKDELGLVNSRFAELDPIMSTDTASSAVITQIYENLTAFPNGVPEIENQLLDNFEVSDDGTTWTFTLRDDVTFHDGSDLTAADVVYSWRRTVESTNSERRSFTLDQPVGLGIDVEFDDNGDPVDDTLAVEAIDDRTVEIQLANSNPDVLDVIAYSSFAIIPEGYVGDITGYDGEVTHQEFTTEVANGTGPFKLDFFNVDEDVRVVRNANYHGDIASIAAVHWEIIEDDQAALTYKLEKNADIFELPTFAYEPDAVEAETDDRNRQVGTYGPAGELNETVNYVGVSELSTYYFGFNAENVTKPVRQAVAHVLNKQQVVEDVFAGRGTPAYSFLPPGMWPTGSEGYNAFVDEYPFSRGKSDLQGAQEALAEADITQDDPAEFTLTTYDSEVFQSVAELIRDLLAGNGVKIKIAQSKFDTLQKRGEDGDLEMYTLGWIWSWPAAPYGMFQLEPKNTNTSKMPGETDGFYLDWQTELEKEQEG